MLVSGRLLAEITRSLPAKPVDVAVLGPRVSIVAGSARFTLPTMPVEDYPPLPQMPGSSGHRRLRRVRRGRRPDRDRGRPGRHAADADRHPGRDRRRSLTLAATDRFRLAVRELELDPGPARHVDRRVGARPHAGRRGQDARRRAEVTIALGDGLLGLEAGGRRTTVRLLDVEFVKYRSLLPSSHTTTVDIPVSDLGDSIKRVALVTDRGHHLRMQVGDGSLTLTAGGDDEGRAEEDLPAAWTARSCSSPSTRHTCWTASAWCTPTRSGWRSPRPPGRPCSSRS